VEQWEHVQLHIELEQCKQQLYCIYYEIVHEVQKNNII